MAILGLRSALGKLGIKFIYNNNINTSRSRSMLGALQSTASNTDSGIQNQKVQPTLYYSRHNSSLGTQAQKAGVVKQYHIPMFGVGIGQMYRSLAGLLRPIPVDSQKATTHARLAVEDFNKQKNAQLQFLRVVMASEQPCASVPCYLYYLTLEALDAGVVKVYRAQVLLYLLDGSKQTQLFGLVGGDNGGFVKLIDNRDRMDSDIYNNRDYVRSFIWDKLANGSDEETLEEVTLSTLHKWAGSSN